MRLIYLLLAVFAVSGCAALLEPAAEEVARGIVKYCDEESPEARVAYRATIAAELPDGYAIHVHCPGDPE